MNQMLPVKKYNVCHLGLFLALKALKNRKQAFSWVKIKKASDYYQVKKNLMIGSVVISQNM